MSHENNFFNTPVANQQKNMVSVESDKAIAEIQSAMVIAKKFPRDERSAMDKILTACSRPTLAETSQYQYAKGGTDITGLSIRMAEALAQCWGNVQYGIKEISQDNGQSTVQSYAWDVETNTRREIVFHVPHIRHTKRGSYPITDPREIYELVANQGSRRLRACILGLIPGDVQDAAKNQCNITLTASCDMSQEAIAKIVSVFASLGVSKAAIEKRLQRRIDTITPAQMINLKNIYNSIKDGMSSPNDWFDSDSGSSDNPDALEKAINAIEKASSKGEIDNVLTLIDGLSSADQKLARSAWMKKVDDLKKKRESKNEPAIESPLATNEIPPNNFDWSLLVEKCRSNDELAELVERMPESVYNELADAIELKRDLFR